MDKNRHQCSYWPFPAISTIKKSIRRQAGLFLEKLKTIKHKINLKYYMSNRLLTPILAKLRTPDWFWIRKIRSRTLLKWAAVRALWPSRVKKGPRRSTTCSNNEELSLMTATWVKAKMIWVFHQVLVEVNSKFKMKQRPKRYVQTRKLELHNHHITIQSLVATSISPQEYSPTMKMTVTTKIKRTYGIAKRVMFDSCLDLMSKLYKIQIQMTLNWWTTWTFKILRRWETNISPI